MNHIAKIKNIMRVVLIAFTVLLVVILLNLAIHITRTKSFNDQLRVINNNSETTDVIVDIYPRGQTTDSWEKKDSVLGTIHAKIYEASISNASHANMKDWRLKIDIQDNCWISNAWNGTIEIHQHDNGQEHVQEISLQNYKEKDLNLKYYISGQDLMIPLTKGDYIIYNPCKLPGNSEEEINSNESVNGQVVMGFIFYSISGNTNLSEYELCYKLEKSMWSGTEPRIFFVLFPIWLIIMMTTIIISIIMVEYEKRIIKQSNNTVEFFDAMARLIDSTDNAKEDNSISVAECARNIAKGLGMKREDCDNVYYATLVRDIGKLQIPDYLMKKTDGLTPEEQEQIKMHTIKGAEILEKCGANPFMADAALYHHESYDGKGYPYGKSGEEIPLIGRIIYLAENYVQIRASVASYNDEVRNSIIEELNKDKGISYDPLLTDVLIDNIGKMDF